MNPMLMMLMMTNPGLRTQGRPAPGSLATMGILYAAAWTLILFLGLGPIGVLIGWPATIAVTALVGGVMHATRATPGDMGIAVASILLLVALVAIGASVLL